MALPVVPVAGLALRALARSNGAIATEIRVLGLKRAAAAIAGINNGVAPKAIRSALSRTATAVKSESSRRLAKAIDVPVKAIRNRHRVRRPKRRRLDARIWLGTLEISLKHLKPRQLRNSRVRARSHLVQPRAFVGPGRLRGHVWQRKGTERKPIEVKTIEVFGPGKAVLTSTALRNMRTRYPRELERAFKFHLNRVRR